MTKYADFKYYTGTYNGAVIDTALFDLYARKATLYIKQYTFNNIDDNSVPDEVRMCCCELAEALYKHETTENNGNITSEKVGEYSVSYGDKAQSEQLFKNKCYDIIKQWLSDTGVLYRGCY